jgi:hypothetical protein
MHLRPGGNEGVRPGLRAAKTEHLMTRLDEVRHDHRPDKARGAGDEYAHYGFSHR